MEPFDVEPPRTGVVLAERYRLGAPLGAGSMGAVYRAEDTTTGAEVAVKILRTHLGDNEEAVSRFAREAALGRRVEHPNCVGVHDAGVCDDGAIFLVMELLAGESLATVLDRERTLPWRRALHIMRHVLRGLDHAHAHAVVHRDIKPDNIFLCPTADDPDFARVLDFGIAKLVGAVHGPALTQAGLTIGTPAYLSPEQAMGAALDGRSDLYSVSAVLFELLTGRPPFEDGDVVRVLTAHASTPAPRFSEVAPAHTVPTAVELMVLEGLAKAPDARMASAAAYIARIDELLASPPDVEVAAAAEPQAGTMIDGRYRLDKLLGRGGMGRVFQATHVGLARRVAIKLLDPKPVGDDDARKRFEREARASGRLQHANCVGVTDFGVDASASRYLVMELVEGVTLDDLLADHRRLPVPRAVDIMRQLLAGLGHAHAHGIIHRDLKPANVMLVPGADGRDVVKVLDFGLARIVDGAGERITRTGIVCGTPRYMAPEQVLDRNLDTRADLYAASVILFEMIAGRTPFDADDAMQILKLHLEATPPRISEATPGVEVSPAIEEVIRRGLSKAPDDRPSSAERYLADLDAACARDHATIELSDGMLSALRVAGPPPLPRRVARKHIAIAGVAASVLLIGVIAAVAGGSSGASPPASARTVDPEPEIEIDPAPARSTDPAVVQALGLAAAGRGEQAVAELKELRKRRPEDAQLPYGLGRVYLKLNWPKPAIAAFRDAIALDPTLRDDPHLIRGLISLLDSTSAWQLAATALERDVGAPAKPALTETAETHRSATVRSRAATIRDRI